MKKIFVLTTLLLAFVLTACSPIAPATAPATAVPSPTVAPTQPAAVAASTFPVGVFLRVDVKSRGLQFNKDGTFVALDGTTHLAEATYSVKGDVFTEESNNQGCPSLMHYKYTFDGVNLKFQPVEDPAKDPCDGRKGDFNAAVTWVLSATAPTAAVSNPTVAPTEPAAAAASTFPVGVFLRADVEGSGLQFNKDGTFAALAGTTHLADGTYSVKGDVFTEESNDQGCPTPMHYKYTFDGVKLKFQPLEDPAKDPCGGRKDGFNETVTWVLSPTASATAVPNPTVAPAKPAAAGAPTFEGLSSGLDNAKQARIRAVSAVMGAPGVDVYVNGLPVVNGGKTRQNMGDGQFSGWIYVTPGTYTVALGAARRNGGPGAVCPGTGQCRGGTSLYRGGGRATE